MQPHYWNDAKKHLRKRCPVMKRLIAQYEGEGLRARGNGFYTLLRSVVGQQISVKAADSVWAKVEQAVKPLTPKKLLSLSDERLRGCGLSASKVTYARNVAEFFTEHGIELDSSPLEGERDLPLQIRGGVITPLYPPPPRPRARRLPLKGGVAEHVVSYWSQFTDEEIVAQLTSIKGIGSWTAEMFLIFHLLRPDVFPVKDLGVLKAIHVHYGDAMPKTVGVAEKWLKPQEYQYIAERWVPYRTVATWYLWRSLDPVAVEY